MNIERRQSFVFLKPVELLELVLIESLLRFVSLLLDFSLKVVDLFVAKDMASYRIYRVTFALFLATITICEIAFTFVNSGRRKRLKICTSPTRDTMAMALDPHPRYRVFYSIIVIQLQRQQKV